MRQNPLSEHLFDADTGFPRETGLKLKFDRQATDKIIRLERRCGAAPA